VARVAFPAIPCPLGAARGRSPRPDDGDRCDHCTLDRLDRAQSSEAGLLIRRALDLRAALKLGINRTLDDIRADEFHGMLILEDEGEKLDREQMRSRIP